jgi:hypothetical protein
MKRRDRCETYIHGVGPRRESDVNGSCSSSARFAGLAFAVGSGLALGWCLLAGFVVFRIIHLPVNATLLQALLVRWR